MNKNIIILGIIGLIVGIIISSLFFGMRGLDNFGWNHMMGWRDGRNINGLSMPNSQTPQTLGTMDAHFIELMIPHHEDAIAMAEIAIIHAEHEEIKTLAEDIKRSQTEENEKMRAWYKEWYREDVPDVTTGASRGMGVMGHGMMMGGVTDFSDLENAEPFDKEFIEQMIPHHQMALMMTSMMLRGTQKTEMRDLANEIIVAQSKEIEQMRSWYQEWYQ